MLWLRFLVVVGGLLTLSLAGWRTEPTRLIIGYESEIPAGISREACIEQLRACVVKVASDRVRIETAQWRALSGVRYVEPDVRVEAFGAPVNDPYFGYQWGIKRVRAPEAWTVTEGSPNMIVAVVDTGARFEHPDLQGKLIAGYDFVDLDGDPTDEHGHGTLVSGVIAASTNNGIGIAGVGYRTHVLVVRVLDANGEGWISDVARGIVYATQAGARVINLSLGGLYSSGVEVEAIAYAWDRDVVLVAAAGNYGSNIPVYPAALDHVLAVAASDENDAKASFSSYGRWVDLVAPGVRILTTDGSSGYRYVSGTSFSAPLVSGTVALMRARGSWLRNSQVVSLIASTAAPINGTGEFWQFGLVDTYRAVAEFKANLLYFPLVGR